MESGIDLQSDRTAMPSRLFHPRVASWAIAALLMSLGWTTAFADTHGQTYTKRPDELIRQTTEQLLGALHQVSEHTADDPTRALELLDQIVSPHVDFNRITRWVLGKQWRHASAVQRQRFTNEFRTLLLRAYGSAVTTHVGANFTYLPVRMENNPSKVTVQTLIPQGGGVPLEINYRLHRKDGRWKVYDLLVEDISLVSTYRTSFAEQVRRVGLDALIAELTARNRQNTDT